MKPRLLLLLRFMAVLLLAFIVMKVVFMLYNAGDNDFALSDVVAVIVHGLPQDLTTMGYASVLPWTICVASIWIAGRWYKPVMRVYACIIGVLAALIFVTDCALYSFWEFKIDDTIYNYIFSPKDVMASISAWYVIVGIAAMIMLGTAVAWSLWVRRRHELPLCTARYKTLLTFVLIGGLIFLMIRGGIGRSTMNVGHVYYSSNQFLNHSAVNPAFSLIYSTLKHKDYSKLYHYFPDDQCAQQWADLHYSTESTNVDKLLTTQRPNIVLIMMEGLGAAFIDSLGGKPNVTPTLNQLCREGVVFTHCYANSYRTDRGTICTLSGYPSFPDLSVMKLSDKSAQLPSIARSLLNAGYTTSYLYGGDKNFTNANSYLLSTGYQQVDGYEHFPTSVRQTHSWGVTDHIVLDTLYNNILAQSAQLKAQGPDRRFFITCQTLASHEDWQVPYHRIPSDPKANAMAYLDHSIGQLLNRLKQTPEWNNLLVILIPDHGISYPPHSTEINAQISHIPLIFTGGAVSQPRRIDHICNQTDLAATLLGQMGITHREFTFSRDIMSQTYTYPCAIHTFSHSITFIDSTGITVRDLNASQPITDIPQPSPTRLLRAQTLLQRFINDLSKR